MAHCLFCKKEMDIKTSKKKFCSDKCRVYFSRDRSVEIKIYTLTNPLTNKIFYVGRTVLKLHFRLQAHIMDRDLFNSKKNTIIQDIILAGETPLIEELESFIVKSTEDEMEVNNREEYWMNQFKEWGFSMSNVEGVIRPNKKRPLIKWEVKDVPTIPIQIPISSSFDFGDDKFLIIEKYTKYPLKDKPQNKFGAITWLKEKAAADAEIKAAWEQR